MHQSSNIGVVRIIGGKYRGRKMMVPEQVGLRPTASRLRETLFNWLQAYSYRTALDAFAGSGALGFEALSRGASHVTFLDQSPVAIAHIVHTAEVLQAKECSAYCRDALHYFKEESLLFDIIFLDPPFESDLLAEALTCLGQRQFAGLIYVELPSHHALPKNIFSIQKKTRVGKVQAFLLQRMPLVSEAE